MPTGQAALFRRVVRQAQVIAEAAGAPARAPSLALELFTSLCWLEPSDRARRVALIDDLIRVPTRPASRSRAAPAPRLTPRDAGIVVLHGQCRLSVNYRDALDRWGYSSMSRAT
jgi:hypothetical protein